MAYPGIYFLPSDWFDGQIHGFEDTLIGKIRLPCLMKSIVSCLVSLFVACFFFNLVLKNPYFENPPTNIGGKHQVFLAKHRPSTGSTGSAQVSWDPHRSDPLEWWPHRSLAPGGASGIHRSIFVGCRISPIREIFAGGSSIHFLPLWFITYMTAISHISGGFNIQQWNNIANTQASWQSYNDRFSTNYIGWVIDWSTVMSASFDFEKLQSLVLMLNVNDTSNT